MKVIVQRLNYWPQPRQICNGGSPTLTVLGRLWTSEELRQYGHSSNCLELLAIYLAIRAFSDRLQIRNICVPADNTTAVSHINTMGGTQFELCSFLAKQIWNSVQSINLYILATHIPGVNNVEGCNMFSFL